MVRPLDQWHLLMLATAIAISGVLLTSCSDNETNDPIAPFSQDDLRTLIEGVAMSPADAERTRGTLEREFKHTAFVRIIETAAIPRRLYWIGGNGLAERDEPYNSTDFINPALPFARLLEAGSSEDLHFLFFEESQMPLIGARQIRPLILASTKLDKFCRYRVPSNLEFYYGVATTVLSKSEKTEFVKSRAAIAEALDSAGWVPILKHGFEIGIIELERCGDWRPSSAEP